ncbi:MAG: 1-(5-phosphoribosyl)-5-[(5-phosphoribosylamino)methylideneamino]imidazole-4-carboxamide isomerase [Solirubrobacteraceae bacterium]
MRTYGIASGRPRVILYPAIDIHRGEAVRLTKGDFDRRTVYAEDPVAAARAWAQAGARFLHVVDLDGARTGEPANLDNLARIVAEVGVPVQYGGGLRTIPAVREALRAGASRVVLGTAAYTELDLLDEVVAAYGPRLVVSVDVRGGVVSTSGWTQTTQMRAESVIERLIARGVHSFVYTSVDRDGMLEGPDPDEVRRVAAAVRGRFIYSGGIGTLADLQTLRDLRQINLAGVIVGKALYEHRFSVAEGQAVLEGRAGGERAEAACTTAA